MKNLIIVPLLLALVSCAPRVIVNVNQGMPELSSIEEIVVIPLTAEVPDNAKMLGTVKIGDSGFTVDCDYPVIIEAAKKEARKYGGNVLKIVEHQTPGLASTCHQITAQIFYVENIADMSFADTTEDTYFDSTANYALIYVYRLGGAPLVSYTVHLGDMELCKVKNKTYEKIMVYTDGPNELWAKTESRESIPINVEFGKEYYLRCNVAMGLFVGRPTLTLVDSHTGRSEFQAMKN